jgi:hypothetical protein
VARKEGDEGAVKRKAEPLIAERSGFACIGRSASWVTPEVSPVRESKSRIVFVFAFY